tara:strand:- start:246 stop:455 length:210 start_codon:yes stop_codon:yes gene_type:complete
MKRTFIYEDGKLVEKTRSARAKRLNIMRDIEPYQNMKDKGWITSRSQHREFLRKNNFIEVGNEQNHLLK